MQPSELWRRGVVLPLDDAAREAIETGAFTEQVPVQVVPIGDEFYQLWRLGLFKDLNAACSTLLDDYEEDWLPASKAEMASQVVDRVARHASSAALATLRKLSHLLAESGRLEQPTLFVL